LPTLFRSKVVVVSGDDKQMPPTSFFSSKVESDEAALFDGEEPEDDATEEERDAYTETWNRREIKDCPDLLHLARVALPTRLLQIHYRSAYRELIAFSNASFYGNRLSVPVRHPDDVVRKIKPIEVCRSDGLYKNQSNLKEATDVVGYLAKMWSVSSPPSVGVVTFNRKQADLIEEVIENKAENDRGFRDALMRERERTEDGEDMSFFVKNVENVQGDERDVVVFSTTFGRNEHGTFRRNFGVLGQAGGERRLNVAVTRARKKIVLMTSMPVAEISNMPATRRQPAVPRDYLQAYLEYASTVSDGAADSGRALLGCGA
jgi:primosomal replication protein N''